MKQETILETDYATLWYYPEAKIIHHKFHKFIHGERFREVLSTGLEIFEKDGAQKWLSDDRNNSTLTAADSDWAVNVWTPRVLAAGWKYWAIVLPDKVVGKMNMQRYIEQNAELGVTVDIFDDTDEALKWLESV